MPKYKKKPVVIEAIQFMGNNVSSVISFTNGKGYIDTEGLKIDTLEGTHLANPGDFIIKGVKGEFYPCKPDIFELTYDKE